MKRAWIGISLVLAASWTVRSARAEGALDACIAAADEGQRQQQSGKFLEARAAFARCSQQDCPTAIQVDCSEWASQLGTRTPSVVLGAVDAAGNELVDVTFTLDGKTITTLPGLAVLVNPGVHGLEARQKDGARGSARFVAREGEHSRAVVVRVQPAPAPVRPAPIATRKAEPTPLPWGPLLLGGGGLALTGLGLGFVVSGATSYGTLQDRCAPNCDEDRVSSARTRSIVGDVLLGAGLVTLAAAGVWFVFSKKSAPPPSVALRF